MESCFSAGGNVRALFLCAPSRAFGEINTLIPLARGIREAGGDVWFMASPLAAAVARREFGEHTFEMSGEGPRNRIVLRRIVRKLRPDLLVFSELYEILKPQRKPDCPLLDAGMIEWLDEFQGALVFVDFIAHTPVLREIAACRRCSAHFGSKALRRFLRRLYVILPCPLNDPQSGTRHGIPYRSLQLPLDMDSDRRARVRKRILGTEEPGYLVLRTGSTWQSKLAEKKGLRLYRQLGQLLAYYFGDMPLPVTLLSISSAHRLHLGTRSSGFRIVNIDNVPPPEFEDLLLACDLILTDNEIAHALCRTIGHTPGVVLVNSYGAEELFETLRDEPIRSMARALERERPGSVFPYRVFPIRAQPVELSDREDGTDRGPSTVRLGRMPSSPFSRVEIFGGERTRTELRRLLADSAWRTRLRQEDADYIARVNRISDGVSVLHRLMEHSRASRSCVL